MDALGAIHLDGCGLLAQVVLLVGVMWVTRYVPVGVLWGMDAFGVIHLVGVTYLPDGFTSGVDGTINSRRDHSLCAPMQQAPSRQPQGFPECDRSSGVTGQSPWRPP